MSSVSSAPLLTRDIAAARDAYTTGDATASKIAHGLGRSVGKLTPGEMEALASGATESHNSGGDNVKAVVLGGLDGILTSFTIVAGAAGAGLSVSVVLVMGISNVLADALSMGVGEYLSAKGEAEYIQREKDREQWELENYRTGEINEMVELFEERGMSHEDATDVIEKMAKYNDFFLNLMMNVELGLQLPDGDENHVLQGFIMFTAFFVFGMLPILAYSLFPLLLPTMTDDSMFVAACAVTALALMGLGGYKAHFGTKKYIQSGAETLCLGGACAILSYTVGKAMADWTGLNMDL